MSRSILDRKNYFLKPRRFSHHHRKFALLSLAMIPLLIVGWMSYVEFRTAITRKITEYSLAQLTQTVANIQLKLAEFENISVRLFINKDFNTTLATYVSSPRGAANLAARKVIEACFNEYMISNQDIFAFMFYNGPNAVGSIVVTKDFQTEMQSLVQNFARQDAYQNILKAGGGIVWSSAIAVKRNHFLIIGRHIKDLETGKPLGILGIMIDEEKIDRLTNMNLYNQLNISFDNLENYSFVINNNGMIVSSPFKNDIGKNIKQVMSNTRPLQAIFQPVSNRDYGNDINQGSFLTKANQRQTLVTYKTISSNIGVGGRSGWHLLSFTPASYLYAELQNAWLKILVIGLLCGGLGVLLAIHFAALKDRDPAEESELF